MLYPRFIEAQGRENKMQLQRYLYILLLCLPCIVCQGGELWLRWKWILCTSHFVDRFIFMVSLLFVWRGKRHNVRMGTIKYFTLYLLLTGVSNILCLHITYFGEWSMFMATYSSSEHSYACMLGFRSQPFELI